MKEIRSTAFHEEALRSERLRTIALITALALLIVALVIRATLSGDSTQLRLMYVGVALFGGFAGYELVMLTLLSRYARSHRQPPGFLWIANIIIETAMPTLALLIVTESEFIGPYRALSAPTILIFILFILFSVLRLSFFLSIMTGAVSAVGYAMVVVYTWQFYPDPPPGSYPMSIYVSFAVFIFIIGLGAAFVSAQIRKHVVAALREAETRREIERIERDLDIARSIQQGLLPQTAPSIEGFDIAGWSQPADQTGGDYYDWQELPDGRVAISIADVTGHGIGPALVTAVCRAYARASFPTGESLGVLMDRINELLVEDLKEGRFVTFVAALLDPRSRQLRILSAGHGPLLLYSRREQRVEVFDADDMPFGVAAGVGYGAGRSIPLESGDIFAMVTDGFFEWYSAADEQFGVERLKAALLESRDLSAQAIIKRLYDRVRSFVGDARQEDDLTAVVIKRDVESQRSASELEQRERRPAGRP